jgi:hypothetical protein
MSAGYGKACELPVIDPKTEDNFTMRYLKNRIGRKLL